LTWRSSNHKVNVTLLLSACFEDLFTGQFRDVSIDYGWQVFFLVKPYRFKRILISIDAANNIRSRHSRAYIEPTSTGKETYRIHLYYLSEHALPRS
jgi:hypothetical protein